MATENHGKSVSLEAAADLSSYQDRFVKLSSGKVTYCGAGQDAIGVLTNDPSAAGRAAEVVLSGIAKVTAGGNCTQDGMAASDSAGRAVNAASGDYILGKFLDAATTAGEKIRVLLFASHPTL
jgi:hypothetical protein